ncbi:hypothetical protein OCU04_011659 [Sclerotinia nivalis]|uniref:Uncharacterized protein n=1 Tax=Sclerotinia nivalis TaxID=352851 RepID=A0A9X0DEP5_9HELO|nr:hypothetical protein OCU04_011659 [Sclerotinia nivalis]
MVLYDTAFAAVRVDQNPCDHTVRCSVREGGPEDPGKRNLLSADDGNGSDNDDNDDAASDGGAKQNQFVLDSRKASFLIE